MSDDQAHIEVSFTVTTTTAIAEALGDGDIERAVNRGLDTIHLMGADFDVDWYIPDEEGDDEDQDTPPEGVVVDLGARMRQRAKEITDGG